MNVSESESCSVVSDSLQPHGLYVACQVPLSMGFPGQEILEWVAIPFSRGSSQPRDWTWVSSLQAGSLLSEPPWILTECEVLHVIVGISKWQLQTYCKRCVLKCILYISNISKSHLTHVPMGTIWKYRNIKKLSLIYSQMWFDVHQLNVLGNWDCGCHYQLRCRCNSLPVLLCRFNRN